MVCLENELEPTGFANAVLLGALLAEIPPTAEAAGPTGLVEETHSDRAQRLPKSARKQAFELGKTKGRHYLAASSFYPAREHWSAIGYTSGNSTFLSYGYTRDEIIG